MVIEYRTVERHIPASLKRPCPKGWEKPGGPEVTGDWIERGDVESAARTVCAARMNKIIEWDKQP